jgi:hypothetical protein
MAARKKTQPIPSQNYLSAALSCAILLAVSVSTVKLFKIWLLMTDEPLVGFTTAALFWVLGAATHFGTRALSAFRRVIALALVYGLKIVPAFVYSVEAHAAKIHQGMLQNGGDAIVNSLPVGTNVATTPGIDVCDMMIFVFGSHPPAVIAVIMVTFGFLVVGDIIAIVLEILHGNLDHQ